MKTLIVAILDESGSMGPKVSDVIGGFNGFLETQKAVKDDEGVLILTKFNTVVSVVHEGKPLAEVPGLTKETYTPGGMTALYDAIAESVRLADKQSFDRAVVLIITDGLENSSRETTREQVKAIVQERTARGNWTFTYLGEQPEQWAAESGMARANVAQYNQKDVKANYLVMAQATTQLRASQQVNSTRFYGGEPQQGPREPECKADSAQ